MASNKTRVSQGVALPAAEAELLRQAVSGGREAFGQLVERYQDRVYNLAFRLTGRHHGALDLSQEAFVRAFAAIGRFRGESGFFTWIYRIVMNLHMNRERSLAGKAEKKTFSLNPTSRYGEEKRPAEPAGGGGIDPSRPAEERERAEAIQQALLGLDEEQRQVVLLRDMEGLSYEEIAGILKVPPGTVKSRLHRARGNLKSRLKGIL
jgi:RNA polymerase sigma-70 factor, ECF subfamily